MAMKFANPIIIKNEQGQFQLIDDPSHTLETLPAKRTLQVLAPYFADPEKRIFKTDLTYVSLIALIKKLNHRLQRKGLPEVIVSSQVDQYIQAKQYHIKEQSEAGLTIKNRDSRWQPEFNAFKKIVDKEIARPLKPEQERASFFLAMMKKAANFSVPGAGKTAMLYGTFAYLSSPAINQVDKLLVVSPLNAFAAWRTEFTAVFGAKRKLYYLNLRDPRLINDQGAIKRAWSRADVITINYESLKGNLRVINELLDSRTMLVFDEVHRIKGINGQRARAALHLSQAPYYRYVLTGTPIPNGFRDVYNFLHLMYPDEYKSFFNWSVNDLERIDADIVNQKLAPFFWRTNKEDLHVPKPDDDIIQSVDPSMGQSRLAEAIYANENGTLATFVRLLQASTNPELLKYNLNYRDLNLLDADSAKWSQHQKRLSKENISSGEPYRQYDLASIPTPKFELGIKLIRKLTGQGKKVLVWAMFIGTMEKITAALNQLGIRTTLIYGATPKEEREGLINQFRNGNVQVLVTNPNTLGESISLHQTVHDAVYFEYNFNLTFMLQSRDRINRLGLPDGQYTRYYYLMTKGDVAHAGFIDERVYRRLKEKEQIMLEAIDGQLLVPEYPDDYLDEVKAIIIEQRQRK